MIELFERTLNLLCSTRLTHLIMDMEEGRLYLLVLVLNSLKDIIITNARKGFYAVSVYANRLLLWVQMDASSKRYLWDKISCLTNCTQNKSDKYQHSRTLQAAVIV